MFSLFIENFRISITSVLANKMRSLLTALGVVIGILAVTLMGTLISGLDHSFEKRSYSDNFFTSSDTLLSS